MSPQQKARDFAGHPATVGAGAAGSVFGILLLLWEIGVFDGGKVASDQEVRDRLTRLEVTVSNLAELSREQTRAQGAMIEELRTLAREARARGD